MKYGGLIPQVCDKWGAMEEHILDSASGEYPRKIWLLDAGGGQFQIIPGYTTSYRVFSIDHDAGSITIERVATHERYAIKPANTDKKEMK